MTTTDAGRGADGGGSGDGVLARRRRAVSAALLLVGLLALGLVAGALLRGWASGPTQERVDVLELDGGRLAVASVRPELMTHPEGMPAGMMPDPVPDGARRVTLDVEIVAGEAPLPYAWDALRLTVPGGEPVAPLRGSLGSGEVPAQARVGGSVLFEVPEDAVTASLGVVGHAGGLELDLPAAPAHGESPDESVHEESHEESHDPAHDPAH